MLDVKLLRSSMNEVCAKLKFRGFDFPQDDFLKLESKRRLLQVTTENLQNRRNELSKEIGRLKSRGGDATDLICQVETVKTKLKEIPAELSRVQSELMKILSAVPNIPHDSVPIGTDEKDNLEIRKHGKPPKFDFAPKSHVELGEELAGIDFAAAAKLSGSRFAVLEGEIARLHRALIQFMLDVHIREHGYTETYVPYIVNETSMFGTGQLPKFRHDAFSLQITDTLSESKRKNEFFLIPTAEVPVTNLVRDEIIDEKLLPVKRVAHTPCFRSEAGSYGRDTKGLIRQHQFEKVELVKLVEPDESDRELESLVTDAESILQQLKLPYRVVSLCAGDLGFSAAKTYDLEVWLPSQNTYREISSCSSFGDFQCRRMRARWRNTGHGKPEFLHSLNGSGLAVGRTLVAIMENCQQPDGSIKIPAVLLPYMSRSSRHSQAEFLFKQQK